MSTFAIGITTEVAILIGLVAFMVLAVALVIYLVYAQKSSIAETQRYISDVEILELIDRQPDGLLSPHQLRDATELTLNQARQRLRTFAYQSVLRQSHNSKARTFYRLVVPLVDAPGLELSPDPFLTVEDLLLIFRHYGGRITFEQLLVATRLPLAVIQREMKHFEKEGILQRLRETHSSGMSARSFFVLQEPYRSNPEAFGDRAPGLNLEMRKILLEDKLIV